MQISCNCICMCLIPNPPPPPSAVNNKRYHRKQNTSPRVCWLNAQQGQLAMSSPSPLLYFKLTLCKSAMECSRHVTPVFICVTHLETLTGSSHCTICDICSRPALPGRSPHCKGEQERGRGYHNDLISMLSPRYHGPRCAAAPWDPRVCALLTALSMQHCVLPTQ